MADTCLFVEPRKGLRLRQCVGRVLRQHRQKVDALVVSPPIIQELNGNLEADSELVRLLSELAGADDELRKSLVDNSFGRVSIVDQRSNQSNDSLDFALEEAATLLSTKVYPRALSSYLTADARWRLGLAQLIQDKEGRGHCRVPHKHQTSSGFALGNWVCAQRSARKANKLTAQLVEQLNSLGFVWDAGPPSWEQRFQRLKAYKQEHGHAAVPRGYVASDGCKLGIWVYNQRQAQNRQRSWKPNPGQKEQLDSLGFVWNAGPPLWEENFQRLEAYKQEHGHAAVPRKYVADDGCKLGRWVDNQREARKGQGGRRIDPEQIEQLDSLGFVWNAGPPSWEQSFQRLKAYKQEHGHASVPRKYVASDGCKLGIWVYNQRQAQNRQRSWKPNPGQKEQLDSLGFVWNAGPPLWEENFQRLEAYKQEHGNIAVPTKYVADDGCKLGRWVENQRTARKGQVSSRLGPEKIGQLDSLGFMWDARTPL
ncbi:unnamed protein product [Polarella glacialis]|uniref:Helicase-associated domain-containing protein n=1 Tax=Polarella glacialis TaxID=89957 RepID=A0A813F9B2_POLGL|nr:unnamed protein product [Polarella glacialis]